ncbi:MAG: sodium:proton antiporter [Planctomycetales bacterium]|nr:sodium:proton antiporter [Planctomycetales bacterium]
MNEQLFTYFLVLVPCLGIAAQWIAWRLQVPSILLLLAFGLLLGVWMSPDRILSEIAHTDESIGPKLLFPLVSLSVAVILFEGGLTLHLRRLGTSAGIVTRLILIASPITWGATALCAHFLLGFSWQLSALLGAILMVTGPTVVGPLLRQIRPNRRVSSVLQWEGILIDPVGAVAAVLVYEAVAHTQTISPFEMVNIVLQTLGIGVILGGMTAGFLVLLLRQYLIPDFLHGVFFLAVAVGAFVLSNMLREESGLVTVTILGICLANQKYVSVEHVLEFKEHLRVLLISCLFIILGSRLQISSLAAIGLRGVPFLLTIILVVRPLSVFLATIGTGFPTREKLFIGAVGPRGIVAASVASVFGLKLASIGTEGEFVALSQAEMLVPVTFLVILGTVAVCGLGAGPLARRLGLAEANPQGILFAGASRWVREIAISLQRLEVRTLLIDTNYGNVTAARMAGLTAHCANVLSEHVQETEDLAGIGRFLAVTPSDDVNTLAAMEYIHIFSRANVYQLACTSKSHQRWESIPETRRGRELFVSSLNYQQMENLFSQGGVVKVTALTETFSLADYRARYPGAIILMVLSAEKTLKVQTVGGTLEANAGDRLIAVLPKPIDKTEQDQESNKVD